MHGNFQEVFLIMLSLFTNVKLLSAFCSYNIFSFQVGDIKLWGGKAHHDYDSCYNLHFSILYDTWSTVENYFQKILRPPWKHPLPFFTHSVPKNPKSASPPFLPTLKIFQALSPAERRGALCKGIFVIAKVLPIKEI